MRQREVRKFAILVIHRSVDTSPQQQQPPHTPLRSCFPSAQPLPLHSKVCSPSTLAPRQSSKGGLLSRILAFRGRAANGPAQRTEIRMRVFISTKRRSCYQRSSVTCWKTWRWWRRRRQWTSVVGVSTRLMLRFRQTHSPLARGPGTTVSYLPILPPKWALLPSDVALYPYPQPIREVNEYHFRLQSDSSCVCPSGRSMYDPTQPTIFKKCKLYTLARVFEVNLELQKCPTCPPKRRRHIGPDLRTKGIFNYNNSILATHELLDAYTSAYTTSETPFIGWVTQTSRLYENVDNIFMGSDLFRSVWFAYVYLQNLVDDMVCTICKAAPETTIWDGLTLAFGKKQLRGSLLPPTIGHAESLVRRKVTYQPAQQLLTDRSLRKTIRDAISPPSVTAVLDTARLVTNSMALSPFSSSRRSSPPPSAGDAPETPTRSAPHQTPTSITPVRLLPRAPAPSGDTPSTPTPSRRTSSTPTSTQTPPFLSTSNPTSSSTPAAVPFSPTKAVLKQVSLVEQHLERLASCTTALRKECPDLAVIFERHLGPAAYAKGRSCSALWKSFFKQVSVLVP